MRLIGTALVFGATLAATAGERDLSPSYILKLWPASVKFPDGLRLYRPVEYTQRSVVLNSQPNLTPYHFTEDDGSIVNPNRQFPYVTPGGIHEASDWKSVFGILIPEGESISVWTDYYPQITNSRPVQRWSYPVGTVAADLLVRRSTGEPFELRMLKKTEEGWRASVPWQANNLPPGYQKSDRKCLTCHQDAGDATRYGLTVRGNDFLFSPPILTDGTVDLDRENWSIRDAPSAPSAPQSRGVSRRR